MPGVAFSPRRNLAIFIGSLFLLLVYMSYQVTDPATGRTVLGNVLFSTISPVESIFSGGFRSIGSTISNYFMLTGVKKENEQLKKDVEQLQIRLAVDEARGAWEGLSPLAGDEAALLEQRPHRLPELFVRARQAHLEEIGFYQRRAEQYGRFLEADTILRLDSVNLLQGLSRLPGFRARF
jgi:hypothetical protein